jgi:hypothetical protein
LTYLDLKNHNNSESNSLGLNLNLGFKANDPSAPQNSKSAQETKGMVPGNLNISLSLQGSESSSTTKATIGQGKININGIEATDSQTTNPQTAGLNRDISNVEQNQKTVINSDFEAELKIDLRLIAAVGNLAIGNTNKAAANWNSYAGDVKNGVRESKKDLKIIGETLETTREIAEDKLGAVAAILTAPTQVIEGTIFTFLEEKNTFEGSYLINKNGISTDPKQTKNYAVNGIITTNDTAFKNYISDPNNDVTLRYNPTHGFFGDLIESGVGKVANIVGTPQIVAMNNYVAEDLYQRSDKSNSTNTFHSQGSIIGTGAMQIYANTYQLGFDLNGGKLSSGAVTINQSQRFVAVGPAVLKSDWYDTTLLLGKKIKENSDYQHNKQDPIRYLAAPSNLITDVAGLFTNKPVSSTVNIPNQITNIPLGIWNAALHIDQHDVKNENYSKFLKSSPKQTSQNPSTIPPNN